MNTLPPRYSLVVVVVVVVMVKDLLISRRSVSARLGVEELNFND